MAGKTYGEGELGELGEVGEDLSPEERVLQNAVRVKIIEQMQAHLTAWMPRIAAAAKTNAGKISVGMKADLSFHGKVGVDTTISFTPEKIAYTLKGEVDPGQPDMFE